MKLVFLGTGGGRYVLINQIRKFGGFYLEIDGKKIYFDPGPGALVNARKAHVPLNNLDILIVTHDHLDHVNDVNVIIECMTKGCKIKNGILISNTCVLRGYENFEKYVTNYHKSALSEIIEINQNKTMHIKGLKFEFFMLKHDEPLTFGVKIYSKEGIFGYISDTEYFDDLKAYFNNCDLLVVNCLCNYGKRTLGHMSLSDLEKLLRDINVGKVFVSHLGYTILKDNIKLLEEKLRKNTNKNVEFAKDFQKYESKTIESFF